MGRSVILLWVGRGVIRIMVGSNCNSVGGRAWCNKDKGQA